MRGIFCFMLLCSLVACTQEKQAGQMTAAGQQEAATAVSSGEERTGAYSLSIVSSSPTRNGLLKLVGDGFGVAETKVTWFVNGEPVGSPLHHFFIPKDLKKGDLVEAMADVKGVEVFAGSIQIKNTPPEILKVRVLPEIFKPGDSLAVDVSASDVDGDEVTFLYEWIRNGESAGNGKMIESPINRGDKVSVKITPYDGEDYGRFVMLNTELQNLPPRITPDGKYAFDGRVFTYQVNAADPDGDSLTFSLKKAPEGVAIDHETGLITWGVSSDYAGKISFTVSVKDGKGGEASQEITLNVSEEAAAEAR